MNPPRVSVIPLETSAWQGVEAVIVTVSVTVISSWSTISANVGASVIVIVSGTTIDTGAGGPARGVTVNVAVARTPPLRLAVMVTIWVCVTAVVGNGIGIVIWPALAAIPAGGTTVELLPMSNMKAPANAGWFNVTVAVLAVPPVTLLGFSVKVAENAGSTTKT